MILKLKHAAVLVAFAAALACAPVQEPVLIKDQAEQLSSLPEPISIDGTEGDANAYAKALLNEIQPRSSSESREYCGYLTQRSNGDFGRTGPIRGGEDYCDLPEPPADVIASWHTHGSYSEVYDNEVPSTADMESDLQARMDGYISTPAGRVWLIDYETRTARQLCGPACVYSDPRNDPQAEGPIPLRFTLSSLRARFN